MYRSFIVARALALARIANEIQVVNRDFKDFVVQRILGTEKFG